MIAAGTLPAYQHPALGPKAPYYITRKDLDKYLDQREKS